MRVTGRNEDFLVKVEENINIDLIKGKVAKIEEKKDTKNVVVEAEDILSGKKIKYETQLAVLATGIVPSKVDFNIETDQQDFIIDRPENGIFSVSCCRRPMDVSASVKEATGAALKAIQIIEGELRNKN